MTAPIRSLNEPAAQSSAPNAVPFPATPPQSLTSVAPGVAATPGVQPRFAEWYEGEAGILCQPCYMTASFKPLYEPIQSPLPDLHDDLCCDDCGKHPCRACGSGILYKVQKDCWRCQTRAYFYNKGPRAVELVEAAKTYRPGLGAGYLWSCAVSLVCAVVDRDTPTEERLIAYAAAIEEIKPYSIYAAAFLKDEIKRRTYQRGAKCRRCGGPLRGYEEQAAGCCGCEEDGE